MRQSFMIHAILIVLITCLSTVMHAQMTTQKPTAFTNYKWEDFSPGTLSIAPKGRGPESTLAREIVFKPRNDERYWCGARAVFPKPVDANLVEFFMMANTPRTTMMKIVGSNGGAGYYHVYAPVNDWSKMSLRREFPRHTENNGPLPSDIVSIEILFLSSEYTAGQEYTVRIAGLKALPIEARPFLNPFWMPAKIPAPVPGYRIETCIHNIWGGPAEFTGHENERGLALAKDVVDNLVKEYGNIGITIAYLRDKNGREFSDYLTSKGGLSLAEGHNAPPEDYLRKNNGLQLNIHGQNVMEAGGPSVHSEDLTNPAVLKHGQTLMLNAAKAGAKAWRTVDYVWAYWGGPIWGYTPTAKQRWKENVSETDVGLELAKGIDPVKVTDRRVAKFWEYFESYHGFRMKPEDLGIKSWDQYEPPKAGEPDTPASRNNRKVFNALYHYEWLKYTNEAARPATEYGLMSQPICNPESMFNGTDLYWLSRLANVRGYATEWWGWAGVFLATYYNGHYYDNEIQANNKEMIFLGESSAAGGDPYNRPNYWDNQSNYLITYAQAASVDSKAKHDQYWGSSWKTETDPNKPEYQSYTAFRSAWSGFLQARNDKAWKPKSGVLAMSMRSVMFDIAPFDGGSGQPFNLGDQLSLLNYVHDGAAFPIGDSMPLEDYKTILLSSFEPPQGFIEKVGNWAQADAERTVITHSFIPTRYSALGEDRYAVDPKTNIQKGDQAAILGLGAITQTQKKTGVLKGATPKIDKLLGELAGQSISFSNGIYASSAECTPIVTLDDQPIISERKVGKGRVIYIHFLPSESGIRGSSLQTALIDLVMRYAGYTPSAYTPDNFRAVMFERDNGKAGRAFVVFNLAARGDVNYKGKVFGVFQAQDPMVEATARLSVGKPNAQVKLTDMITLKTESLISDAEGYITVNCDGWNMRGVFWETP